MIWRPDTCDCAFQCDVDQSGELVWRATLATCPDHAGLAGQAHIAAVHKENRRKNQALGMIRESYPEVGAKDISARFARGVLEITGRSLSPAQVTSLQEALDQQCGPGQVRVL